jgi:hypothetical protein
MRCLTPSEISQWLSAANQIENPYSGEAEPDFHVQFYPSKNYSGIECFVSCFLDQVVTHGDLLVVISDPGPSQPCQRFVSDAIRKTCSEDLPIDQAPGYSVKMSEREKALAVFSLTACFGWKCFLYGSHDQITLYNWEGDVFDFWTSSQTTYDQVLGILRNFELEVFEDED